MAAKAGSPIANTPSVGHNQPTALTQDDLDDLFLVHLAQARADDDLLEAAMEKVRAVRKQRTRNRNECRTDGFPLTELDNIISDEKLPRHEVEEREAKRLRMRGVANQPGGSTEVQPDMFADSFAKRAKDEAYWRGHGLTSGLRGLLQNPEDHEVPPEWHQVWLEEWHEGQKRLAKAMLTKARIEGKEVPQDQAASSGAASSEPSEASASSSTEPEAANATAGELTTGAGSGPDTTSAPDAPPAQASSEGEDAGASTGNVDGESGDADDGEAPNAANTEDHDDADTTGVIGFRKVGTKGPGKRFDGHPGEGWEPVWGDIATGQMIGDGSPPADDDADAEGLAGISEAQDRLDADPFEASEEELAAQKTRQGIQEAKAEPTVDEPCAYCGAPVGEPCAPDCENPATEPLPA